MTIIFFDPKSVRLYVALKFTSKCLIQLWNWKLDHWDPDPKKEQKHLGGVSDGPHHKCNPDILLNSSECRADSLALWDVFLPCHPHSSSPLGHQALLKVCVVGALSQELDSGPSSKISFVNGGTVLRDAAVSSPCRLGLTSCHSEQHREDGQEKRSSVLSIFFQLRLHRNYIHPTL